MKEFIMKRWWNSFNEELYLAYLEAKLEMDMKKK